MNATTEDTHFQLFADTGTEPVMLFCDVKQSVPLLGGRRHMYFRVEQISGVQVFSTRRSSLDRRVTLLMNLRRFSEQDQLLRKDWQFPDPDNLKNSKKLLE